MNLTDALTAQIKVAFCANREIAKSLTARSDQRRAMMTIVKVRAPSKNAVARMETHYRRIASKPAPAATPSGHGIFGMYRPDVLAFKIYNGR